MNTYRVKVLEQEQWERTYIVKASSKANAIRKIHNTVHVFKPVLEERYNFEDTIDSIKIVED